MGQQPAAAKTEFVIFGICRKKLSKMENVKWWTFDASVIKV